MEVCEEPQMCCWLDGGLWGSDIPVIKIILSFSFYKVFLEIISVQFQYLHHFSNSFVIDNIQTQSSA